MLCLIAGFINDFDVAALVIVVIEIKAKGELSVVGLLAC